MICAKMPGILYKHKKMVREATPQDYAIIQAIALDCFDHNVAKISNLTIARFMMKRYYRVSAIEKRLKDGNILIVDEENGQINGFFDMQKGLYLANIFVSPKMQRKGIGHRLMEEGIDRALAKYPETTLITLDATKDAIKFYEKFGFVFLDRTKSQFGVDFYPMSKTIEKNIENKE